LFRGGCLQRILKEKGLAMKNIVGSMSDWSGVLKDLFRQVNDGSITLAQTQAFVEHRNPFGDGID